VFILGIVFLSSQAQSEFFGKYKFYSENDEAGSLNLNCNKTFLMEDTMLITKDSSITSVVKGTWRIRKSKTLTLFVDSIISRVTATGNLKSVQYFIRDGRFYLKIPNEKQYITENKKLDKEISSCLPGLWEDYQVYKAKQEKRYFFKIDNFNCIE
jgi:hypothetical protein